MRTVHAILRFWRDRRGVAAVEFALILPVLLLLYFGTIETASLYSADRRVANVAGTIGDLVSRSNETISTAELNDYFQAASGILQPYPTGTLSQVVSLLQVASNGTVTVKWSRNYNGGSVRNVGDPFPLAPTDQMNLLARNGYLVAAEARYSYRPFFGIIYPNALVLQHTEFYIPRFEEPIAIN